MSDQDRDVLIKNEQARVADVAARRAALLKELDAPEVQAVLAHKRAEDQLRRIQIEQQTLAESDSARRGQFRRDLERCMPPELAATLQAAKAELHARRRTGNDNPEALRQLADLRSWYDSVEVALRDPDVTSARLFEMAAEGKGRLSPEGTVAYV